jgi:hypothetical protein
MDLASLSLLVLISVMHHETKVRVKQPLGWKHANLEQIKAFLLRAVDEGAYTPCFTEGLFD